MDHGIEMEGSNLSGVSARCAWLETDVSTLEDRKRPDEKRIEKEYEPYLPQISDLGKSFKVQSCNQKYRVLKVFRHFFLKLNHLEFKL